MALLLGIDIGTSGTKTLLCNTRGSVVATATVPHSVSTPKPGWSEQDPAMWWTAVGKATKAVLREAGAEKEDVIGVGLSGQMHGSVFIDADDAVLRPALLWNDQRTAKQCDDIEKAAGGRKKLINMVGNPALTGFTAPKLLWVRDNEPKLFKKTKRVLLPKDYIRLLMTGVYATEVSDASGTLLLDVKKRAWNKTLMKKLDLDPEL
ncbi:MAG: FGGY family carbohydrate kinase, partial [Phycisphaeraceae bacterium]